MRITSVTYRHLVSFGSYEHEAVEATAEVGNANAADVLTDLKAWVNDQITDHEAAAQTCQDLMSLSAEKRQLEYDISQLKSKFERAKAFLERIGIKPNPYDLDDVPW